MGITKDKELFKEVVKDRCFYCGGGFVSETPYVYWSGFTRDGGQIVVMHPTCTLNLAKHLIKDAMLTWENAGQIDAGELAIHLLRIVEDISRIDLSLFSRE